MAIVDDVIMVSHRSLLIRDGIGRAIPTGRTVHSVLALIIIMQIVPTIRIRVWRGRGDADTGSKARKIEGGELQGQKRNDTMAGNSADRIGMCVTHPLKQFSGSILEWLPILHSSFEPF